jgi:hypothetical protein
LGVVDVGGDGGSGVGGTEEVGVVVGLVVEVEEEDEDDVDVDDVLVLVDDVQGR